MKKIKIMMIYKTLNNKLNKKMISINQMEYQIYSKQNLQNNLN